MLVYSQLKSLDFFDIEEEKKKVLENKENSLNVIEPESDPLDFIKPVMLFYLQTIRYHDIE